MVLGTCFPLLPLRPLQSLVVSQRGCALPECSVLSAVGCGAQNGQGPGSRQLCSLAGAAHSGSRGHSDQICPEGVCVTVILVLVSPAFGLIFACWRVASEPGVTGFRCVVNKQPHLSGPQYHLQTFG